jgi:hypothetical protein
MMAPGSEKLDGGRLFHNLRAHSPDAPAPF